MSNRLKDKADNVFSLYIRQRDGMCALAGQGGIACSGRLECCHWEERGFMALRYDEENAFAGCLAHHRDWWHSMNPQKSRDAKATARRLWPERWEHIQEVLEKYRGKNKINPMFVPDYENVIKLYQSKLQKL